MFGYVFFINSLTSLYFKYDLSLGMFFYHILRTGYDKQLDFCNYFWFDYLKKAKDQPHDGEALYEWANLLLVGTDLVEKNESKAKELFGKAASLNYQPAKEKLAMF